MNENSGNTSFFDRLNHWIKNSIMLKMLSIGILTLILLIPVGMVEDIIYKRENYHNLAVKEVGQKWGNAQQITALVLSVPFKRYSKGEKDKIIEEKIQAYFLPEKLQIKGRLEPEKRYRGIFEVIVYKSVLQISGEFRQPNFSEWDIKPEDIIWKEATITMGLSDMRGINNEIKLQWNEENFAFNPGANNNEVIPNQATEYNVEEANIIKNVSSGVSARVPLNKEQYHFSLSLNLNGSEKIEFFPLGKTTEVHLSSSWNSPSFSGAFLPDKRKIDDQGFEAYWQVLHLNRNYPQKWQGNDYQIDSSAFGTELFLAVDNYQKNTRAVKYAILLITLTFVSFFFIEIINRKRIHPFQYFLVGLALCLFYTLLLSLSEYLLFNSAYLIACGSVITLIITYTSYILQNKKLVVMTTFYLLFMYGFTLTLLQLEDYALLIGSIGLFVILAVIMMMSRKIDWYHLNQE